MDNIVRYLIISSDHYDIIYLKLSIVST